MSGKSFVNVRKEFAGEAVRVFDFLQADFGLLPNAHATEQESLELTYSGDGFRYVVMLNPMDRYVVTMVEKDLDTVRLSVDLRKLVSAAGLGKPNQVASSAQTVHNLLLALESQAGYVRSIHPLMIGDDAVALMRKAHAHEWLRS